MLPPAPSKNASAYLSRASDGLKVGMHVRIPDEPGRVDGQFRQFYLGRVEGFDDVADTVRVRLYDREIDGEITERELECPSFLVQRCHILPDSKVALVDRDAGGTVLAACESEFSPGQFCDYFVQIEGRTTREPECNLIVASHRADPDPRLQLLSYELQNPTFRRPRDLLVESYAELRTATFGIEDLVGSRIMLLAHQAEVVATVLSDAECRYVLADEVGLGKTIEAAVILKGLRRRHAKLEALIVVPASLSSQWYFELDHKFWLRFRTAQERIQSNQHLQSPGLILSHEQLLNEPETARWVMSQHWDLLIVDEAHHVPRRPELNRLLCDLSATTPRVLLLSATPIQRRATEFLALLKLLHPVRYHDLSDTEFSQMLGAQYELLRIVTRVAHDLTAQYFDPDDFCEEMDDVLTLIPHDRQVANMVERVKMHRAEPTQALSMAQAAVAYIGENYRLERRVIRNRRANLDLPLPVRRVNEEYAYIPADAEISALDELHEYADAILTYHNHAAFAQELVRLLFHAAFSSPHALLALLQKRQNSLVGNHTLNVSVSLHHLVAPVSPREEERRIPELLVVFPAISDEARVVDRVVWHVQRWRDETVKALDELPNRLSVPRGPHRFVQVLAAVDKHRREHSQSKIVIFSGWADTLLALKPYLRKQIGREGLYEFHARIPQTDLQNQAIDFQETEGQAILLCDELGGEGRNFQVANLIIHLDLPWTPARLEQRIGRVDRLGREGDVTSVVLFAREQIEQDLYHILQRAFELFTRSMSGMEIALEDIQDELVDSLRRGTRDGLRSILDRMIVRAAQIRQQVEEERIYEEGAINTTRRDEFVRIGERYANGSVLREPILKWAAQAGLAHTYHSKTDTVYYFPRDFSMEAMRNAKFVEIPNMEEALLRSRNSSNLRVEGTFNRSVAVVREDLVFFAPGSDPWTDAIIRNALEADRGRCCAIRRSSPEIDRVQMLFDLMYRVQVDPRPLLAAGHDPIQLLQAQGFLYTPIHRLLLSHKGERIPPGHTLQRVIQAPFHNGDDIHLGQRSGNRPPIDWFKEKFPTESWRRILQDVFGSATEALSEDFAFMEELADEAKDGFEETARGMRAAADWYIAHKLIPDAAKHLESIESYRDVYDALVAGIRHPHFILESVCCWILLPSKR